MHLLFAHFEHRSKEVLSNSAEWCRAFEVECVLKTRAAIEDVLTDEQLQQLAQNEQSWADKDDREVVA